MQSNHLAPSVHPYPQIITSIPPNYNATDVATGNASQGIGHGDATGASTSSRPSHTTSEIIVPMHLMTISGDGTDPSSTPSAITPDPVETTTMDAPGQKERGRLGTQLAREHAGTRARPNLTMHARTCSNVRECLGGYGGKPDERLSGYCQGPGWQGRDVEIRLQSGSGAACTDGRTDERTDGRTDERTDGYMEGRTDARTDGRRDDARADVSTHGRMDTGSQ